MATGGMVWDVWALQAAFARLSDELKAEVRADLAATAETLARTVAALYPQGPTGNLRAQIRTQHEAAGSRVRAYADHTHLFEFGTTRRMNYTKQNANRGTMPAGRVFIPAAARARRAMLDRLQASLDAPREIV